VTVDLIGRAKAGDEQAFRQLVGPYQRELQLHCYRILGSAQDAEDALQETLLAAWRGLARFEGRCSVRSWLYRVATSCCLKALRSASRQLGMQACPVCGSADSLGMSPFPVLLVDAGPSRDDDTSPGDEHQEGDMTFAVRVECATCGHLMLFNSLRYRTGDEKIMVRELTD
jgi:RNA polymerase sigma factor (sigma-70 family)